MSGREARPAAGLCAARQAPGRLRRANEQLSAAGDGVSTCRHRVSQETAGPLAGALAPAPTSPPAPAWSLRLPAHLPSALGSDDHGPATPAGRPPCSYRGAGTCPSPGRRVRRRERRSEGQTGLSVLPVSGPPSLAASSRDEVGGRTCSSGTPHDRAGTGAHAAGAPFCTPVPERDRETMTSVRQGGPGTRTARRNHNLTHPRKALRSPGHLEHRAWGTTTGGNGGREVLRSSAACRGLGFPPRPGAHCPRQGSQAGEPQKSQLRRQARPSETLSTDLQ